MCLRLHLSQSSANLAINYFESSWVYGHWCCGVGMGSKGVFQRFRCALNKQPVQKHNKVRAQKKIYNPCHPVAFHTTRYRHDVYLDNIHPILSSQFSHIRIGHNSTSVLNWYVVQPMFRSEIISWFRISTLFCSIWILVGFMHSHFWVYDFSFFQKDRR